MMPYAELLLIVKLLCATKNTVVVPERLNLHGPIEGAVRPPNAPGTFAAIDVSVVLPKVVSRTFVVLDTDPRQSVMLVAAFREKYTRPPTSQSPAVSEMLAMVKGVAVVRAKADPEALVPSMYSPIFPAAAFPVLASPRICPCVISTEPIWM
jgi:hypothetical protein